MPKRQKPERYELILSRYGFEPQPPMKTIYHYYGNKTEDQTKKWTPFRHPSNGSLVLVNKDGYYAVHNTHYLSEDVPNTRPAGYRSFKSGRELECWCCYEFVRGKE